MIRSDLVGTAEIAALLNKTRKHVRDVMIKTPGFPAPVIDESQKTRLWSAEAVLRWYNERAKTKRSRPHPAKIA